MILGSPFLLLRSGAAVCVAAAALVFCGCASLPASKADVAATAQVVAALTADVQDIKSDVGTVKARTAKIDQSTNNFDKWGLRAAIIAPPAVFVIVALAYLFAKSVHGRVTRRNAQPPTELTQTDGANIVEVTNRTGRKPKQ